MTEQAKAEQLSPGCDSDATTSCCYPLRKWWQPGWPSYPDHGPQPVLELGNLPQGRWPGCSPWLGYAPSPLFVPSCVSSPNASTEQYKWRVILDMTHFAPSEISVSVQEGFLAIGGSHSERPDVFGFTARSFTRKYRLPVGIVVSKLTSVMSGDGILCVEAPLPDTYSIPADIAIPIQVEKETIGGHKMQEDHKEATPETHTENGEPQQSEPTAPEQPPTEEQPSTEAPDHGEEDSPLAGDDNKQEEEVQEAEVNGTTPSGEPHPLAPADEEGPERFPEPSEHSEALDNQDNTASSMEQQTEEPSKEENLETDAESRETQPTAPVPSDQQAAEEDHSEEAAHPGSVAGDLQEHEEGTEEDAETHAEPTAEPHPALTPAASDDGTSAESLPDPPPPEHREEGTEEDAETHAEPTAEPHPALTPAASDDGTSAESLPDPPPPEHEEGTEEDAETHAEPTAEPHPALTPAASDDGTSAESLPDPPPPEHHEEGTEEDAETHVEPTAEPHPALTPAASDDGTSAESLPDPPPPEHREALDGQDSPAAGTAAASAEPAHNGEIQPEEEATEEITQQQQQQQHEEPELVKGLPSDGLSQELLDLAAPEQ